MQLRKVLSVIMIASNICNTGYAAKNVPPRNDPKNLSQMHDQLSDGNGIREAIRANDKNRVMTILDTGLDINKQGETKRTPLSIAANWQRKELVELLLTKGANPNLADMTGITPLHEA